jgi:pyruvate-formate lyase
MSDTVLQTFPYAERIERLRETKLRHTREKQELIGSMDHDDWALILPPEDRRKVVEAVSTSGMPIKDCLLDGYEPESNHPNGGFFGAVMAGRNFRRLLETHPPYVDPDSSLAGGYMVNFSSYRKPRWNPDLTYDHLTPAQERYGLITGIGGSQHFCQEMTIGYELGWGGLLEKIRTHRGLPPKAPLHPAFRSPTPEERTEFYQGLEDVVLGMQDWIGRTADHATALASKEPDPVLRKNLEEVSTMNVRLVSEPPRTFREACQWTLWYLICARMYNGSGSLGRLDTLLEKFYRRDTEAGILDDEQAIFHLACLLLRDTAYLQLGGYERDGTDSTNRVSYLVLEAAHRLKVPANVAVSVGEGIDPGLLHRGVAIIMEDRLGIPKFLGADQMVQGFVRNGYSRELAFERAYAGCHWYGIPGREYTMMDMVKINFGRILEVALREMNDSTPSTATLYELFLTHLKRAVHTIAEGLDYHCRNMYRVFPELVLDLLCRGPIERGLDASRGGVDYYNMCLDGAALATVADSFAALEQRVDRERKLPWKALMKHLDDDWAGQEGETARRMMQDIPRFGSGGSRADEWAVRIAGDFTRLVKAGPTPGGLTMIPGIFSWANTVSMGRDLGATPNGRRAGEPISHGANPDPGFGTDGAPTALAVAVAAVQPGYGNTAPLQLDLSPSLQDDEPELVAELLRTHFTLGGTQINLNVVDRETILAADREPEKYPDLIVRVTGFSAYFASLSPEFRKMVVERLVS